MYYDLVASLPQMRHFSRAERLPITKLRLIQRLKRLTPSDAAQLQRAHALVAWRGEQLRNKSDAEIVREYAGFQQSDASPALREFVEFRVTQQTLVAAARRKHTGEGPPDAASAWGAGEHVHVVRRNWSQPNFGLAYVYPWLPKAIDRLESSDPLGAEKILADAAWTRLSRIAEHDPFGFGAVFSFVFKWDILQAWLAQDAARGKMRFSAIIDEVIHV